jgi:redox-sensing transcriptional repressor
MKPDAISEPSVRRLPGAAFNNDPGRIGLSIAGTKVLSLDQFVEYYRSMNVKLGVITTSWGSAQSVADSQVEGGIRAIWNFAPAHLQVQQSAFLQNEDPYRSLVLEPVQ